eukprot:GSA25T00003186001.1
MLEDGDDGEDTSPGKINKSVSQIKVQIENPYAMRDIRDIMGTHTLHADALPLVYEPGKTLCVPGGKAVTEAVLEDVNVSPGEIYLNATPQEFSTESERRAVEKSPVFNEIARSGAVDTEGSPKDEFAQPLSISLTLRNTAQKTASFKKLIVRLTEVVTMMGQPVGSDM